ncbi:MAG: hypothetical protein IJI45_14540 [Anaerolineaceae bacterium]|nr:hypothetical protein [Anaerolineaceae bacterium]
MIAIREERRKQKAEADRQKAEAAKRKASPSWLKIAIPVLVAAAILAVVLFTRGLPKPPAVNTAEETARATEAVPEDSSGMVAENAETPAEAAPDRRLMDQK